MTFTDSYKIFPKKEINISDFPLLNAFVNAQISDFAHRFPTVYRQSCYYDSKILSIKMQDMNLLNSTRGTVTMKMLLVHADGNEHHFKEMAKACNIPEGNDIDCYRSLINRDLIAFSSKHAYGSKYYKITDRGRFVLDVIKINDVFYKPTRWFKGQDEENIYKNMLICDVNSDEYALDDISEESFLNMVKALLDLRSDIHRIGSAYKWMNAFMRLVKTCKEFYSYVDVPAVNAWLDANANLNSATKAFYPMWKRIQKKWKKAA